MRRVLLLDEFFENMIVLIGRIAAWVAIALIAVIIFDVITRRFLVLGSTKLQEFEWHIHAVLFLLCLGYGYIKDSHVRIDLVRERLASRTKIWIELIGCLLFLIPYAFLVVYYGVDWWHRSFGVNEMSGSATGLPYRWMIKAFLPIGFLLLLASGISTAFRKIIQLFGPPELVAMVDAREQKEFVHLDEVDELPGMNMKE